MQTPLFWKEKRFLSTALLPASWLYAAGAALDRRFTTPQHVPIPVISVGNITAGGAGKTPTCLALLPLVQQLGMTAHVITRGYGGTMQQLHRVAATDNWRVVGDEPLLLATAAPTWVSAHRIDAARAACTAGATVLIADDAMQHHTLHKDISLLVIDGAYGIGNGRLLPAGPLRESLESGLARCDAVILIGDDAHQLAARIHVPIFRATLVASGDISWTKGASVIAFAGIAQPQKFFHTLQTLGVSLVSTHSFADHHPYQRSEIESLLAAARLQNATLVTTAKDAVKIPEDLRTHIKILDVALQWNNAPALTAWLKERLTA